MTSSQTLKIGVAQMQIVLADIPQNLNKHSEIIVEARQKGVDVLVFPELSLTGYRTGVEGYKYGMRLRDESLRKLARESGDMYTTIGFIEEGFAAQYYNSAAVLHQGQVIHVHRKLNLPTYGDMDEGKHFATGRYVDVFEMGRDFIGSLLICSDLWNPGLVHLTALYGSTLLMVPTNSSIDLNSGDDSKPERWSIFLKHYSTIYGLPIAFANRIGQEDCFKFWGGSRIINPFGEVLVQAKGDEETLLIAEVDYREVCEARFKLPTVRDSNLALIQREINRLVERLGIPEVVRTAD